MLTRLPRPLKVAPYLRLVDGRLVLQRIPHLISGILVLGSSSPACSCRFSLVLSHAGSIVYLEDLTSSPISTPSPLIFMNTLSLFKRESSPSPSFLQSISLFKLQGFHARDSHFAFSISPILKGISKLVLGRCRKFRVCVSGLVQTIPLVGCMAPSHLSSLITTHNDPSPTFPPWLHSPTSCRRRPHVILAVELPKRCI